MSVRNKVENHAAENRKTVINQKHACNDITLVRSKGGASDTVRARNIGLKEENGKRIWVGQGTTACEL
jgi:hypothetical protein